MRLEIKNLSFSFGESKVLNNVSLIVEEGEFLGLMGPNGSGKTTLLRCLGNYLPSEAGAILIDMKPLHALTHREIAKTFGIVPQSSSTDFSFSAYDIVMMGRIPHIASRLAGEGKTDVDIVRNAMKLTNTWQFANRPFNELSGGEKQRVIIARALAQNPRALLLDEPTVYLDISGQLEIMDLLRSLNRSRQITIIAVLHDVNLAARYCDRIALLSHGMLEAVGAPNEILSRETIQSVYGLDVVIRRDPLTGAVYIIPRSSMTPVHRHGTRVHILSGGGTGGPILEALHDHGFSVSAGVLNVLDSDFEIANDLHLPVVAEIPFAQISNEAYANNLRMIDESSIVVVSRFPVGPGNFKNLEAAMHAVVAGKRVFVIQPIQAPNIDFVGGRADVYIKELISSGAVVVTDIGELVARLSGEGG